jgi:hypothetical protein
MFVLEHNLRNETSSVVKAVEGADERFSHAADHSGSNRGSGSGGGSGKGKGK